MWWLVMPAVLAITVIALALRRTRYAAIAMRVSRWTYCIVVPLSLLFFPIHAGWRFHSIRCEWTFGPQLAAASFLNWKHILLCTILFLVTFAQLPRTTARFAWSFAACFALGFSAEIAQGITRVHNCRMRDLIPDMTGGVIGSAIVLCVLLLNRRAASSLDHATY